MAVVPAKASGRRSGRDRAWQWISTRRCWVSTAIDHPECRHIEGNVWSVNPREVTGGQNPDVLWLSPVCKEFSQAKTGRARDPKVMNLAWVAASSAASVKPRVIVMENVKGMLKWGPLSA